MKPRAVNLAFLGSAVAGLCLAFGLGGLATDSSELGGGLVAAAAFSACAGVAAAAFARRYPHERLGLCNLTTLLRLALACALVGALFAGEWSAWPVFVVAALAFGLDGLDGYFARREGLSSAFGARFDMEVDSILALTLAVLAFQSGSAGAYVLLLGIPRYLFGAAQLALPWLNGDLPPRFSRKVVCVIQIGTLLLMVFPPIGTPLTDLVAAIAALALLWSFWRDISWLRRAARA